MILAGGFGTRIAEETYLRPKPMIEIGERPILWHIMKSYSHFGFNEFIICLGYKGYCIKEYFANYFLHNCDVTFELDSKAMTLHQTPPEAWRVTLVETGINTMTGGRVQRCQPYLNGERFLLTYGDGVANVDIGLLLEYHLRHGKTATVTAVQPSGRFGAMQLDGANQVTTFQEKPEQDYSWVNGGFFVLEPRVFDFIQGDMTVFEKEPLAGLAAAGELMAYKHAGFWQPMDTLRDKNRLEELWQSGQAPWKVW